MKLKRKNKASRQLRDDAVDPAVMAEAASTIAISSDLLAFVNVDQSEHSEHRDGIRGIRWVMTVSRVRTDPHARQDASDPKINVPKSATRKRSPLRLGLSRMTRQVSPQAALKVKPIVERNANPSPVEMQKS